MSKKKFLLFRSVQTVVLIWVVMTMLFLLFKLMPGSFVDLMYLEGASDETIEAFRDRWGLDEPLYVQYWNYMKNLLLLDPGNSLQYRIPVVDFVSESIFNTFILVAPAITLSYVIGSVFGVVIGSQRGTRLEQSGTIPFIVFGVFPEFVVAILLIAIFSVGLGWLPTSGMISPTVASEFDVWWRKYLTVDFLKHYILPFSVIVLRYSYLPVLLMRTSTVEVSDQDFMNYHKITGVPKLKRLMYLSKHASLPVITMYPISLARAISGLIVIEIVFSWPGIGFKMVEAVLNRDFPVLMFVFLVTAIFVILANFVVDVLYGYIDPRISVD